MNIKRTFTSGFLILLVIMLLLPGCSESNVSSTPAPQKSQPATQPEAQTTPSLAPLPPPPPPPAPSQPMQAKLSVSEPPELGKPVQLTTTLTIIQIAPIENANNTSVEVILPEGFELVNGNLKGTINVSKGNPAKFQVAIKSVKTGDWELQAKVIYSSPGSVGNVGVANAYLYIKVSDNSATVSDVPIGPKIGHGTTATPPPGYEGLTPATPSPPPTPEPPVQEVPPAKIPSSALP